MEILIGFTVVLHLLGMAAIVAGWLASYLGAAGGLTTLVWGARVQLLLGLALVGLLQANHEEVNWPAIAVKLVVALAVAGCAEAANAAAGRGQGRPVLTHVALGLTIVNTLVAVLWLGAEPA